MSRKGFQKRGSSIVYRELIAVTVLTLLLSGCGTAAATSTPTLTTTPAEPFPPSPTATPTSSLTAPATATVTSTLTRAPTMTATSTSTMMPTATARPTRQPTIPPTDIPSPLPTSTPAEIIISSFGVTPYPIEGKCAVGLFVKITSPAPLVSVKAEWSAYDDKGNTIASRKVSMGGQGDGETWWADANILEHFLPGSRIEWSVTASNTLLQLRTETAPPFFFGEGC